MILAQLKDFEWLNDPQNVTFTALGMRAESKKGTDFWQNDEAGIHKDNGHFFYLPKTENFTLTLSWDMKTDGNFDQCGIMVRIDEKNWIKASLLFENRNNPAVASSATVNGFSDWATHKLSYVPDKICYQLKRIRNDFVILYSLDGEKFEQIRMVHMQNPADFPVLAGAYICSPRSQSFSATLTQLDFSE